MIYLSRDCHQLPYRTMTEADEAGSSKHRLAKMYTERSDGSIFIVAVLQ
jgi:hypothetical protein